MKKNFLLAFLIKKIFLPKNLGYIRDIRIFNENTLSFIAKNTMYRFNCKNKLLTEININKKLIFGDNENYYIYYDNNFFIKNSNFTEKINEPIKWTSNYNYIVINTILNELFVINKLKKNKINKKFNEHIITTDINEKYLFYGTINGKLKICNMENNLEELFEFNCNEPIRYIKTKYRGNTMIVYITTQFGNIFVINVTCNYNSIDYNSHNKISICNEPLLSVNYNKDYLFCSTYDTIYFLTENKLTKIFHKFDFTELLFTDKYLIPNCCYNNFELYIIK